MKFHIYINLKIYQPMLDGLWIWQMYIKICLRTLSILVACICFIHLRKIMYFGYANYNGIGIQQQQQQHSLFSQASWGRLEMKPERNKFKVQAH